MPNSRIRGIARITAFLALISIGAKGLGFLREVLISTSFGANAETDAFYLVLTLTLVFGTMLELAISRLAVPRISAALEFGRAEAVAETWGMAAPALAVTGTVTALLAWQAAPTIHWIAPGFEPETSARAARLLRIMAPVLPCLCLAGFPGALARARGHFLLVQTSMLLMNIGAIVGLLLGRAQLGIEAAAWGVLLGTLCQTLVVVSYPFMVALPQSFSAARLRGGLDALPALAALTVLSSTGGYAFLLLARYFASLLPEGHLSCIGYAQKLITLPQAVLVSSLLVVLLSRFSELAARQDREEASALLVRSVRVVMLATVPPFASMAVLATPIVRLVYARGAFDEGDLLLTARLIQAYPLSLVATTIVTTLVTASLGFGSVWKPNALGVGRALAVAAVYPFVWKEHGAVGLVLSLGVIDVCLAFIAAWTLRFDGLAVSAALPFVGPLMAVTVACGLASHSVWTLLGPTARDFGSAGLLLGLAAAGGAGAAAMVAVGRAFSLSELDDLLDRLPSRWRKA